MSEISNHDELTPRERYAQELDELTTPELLAMKDFLGEGIGRLVEFSFDNASHVDLRNRFLGSTLALQRRSVDDLEKETKKDDSDDGPPSYMLRVDGGVDVVSSAGVKASEKDGVVPPDQIIASFSSRSDAKERIHTEVESLPNATSFNYRRTLI